MNRILSLSANIFLTAFTFTSIAQDAIFLHHSIGNGMYTVGNIAGRISDYNANHGANFTITERYFPDSPYPASNIPYDYWNLWVNNACNNNDPDIACLSGLCANYDLVIFKHCYPSAEIEEDTDNPSVSSQNKTIENYKLQYRALRDLLDSYPDNKFILWTLAPCHRLGTTVESAARARQFVDWVKTEWLTEDGKEHPNIYIFDFFGYVAESDPTPENGQFNCLKYRYEVTHSENNSHPNNWAYADASPFFAELIINTLKSIGETSETGKNSKDGDPFNLQITQSEIRVQVNQPNFYEFISVYSIPGNLLLNERIIDNPYTMNVSSLPGGNYVVQLSDAAGKADAVKVCKP